MFEYIRGKVAELRPANIVVEAGGIGYFVHISLNSYSALNGKQEATVFLHQVVREDAHLLYGFATGSERELFRLLISVTGIGSNTALMMLSSLTPEELKTAILSENVHVLKSIKGIGAKTAQRVIIDLKDKIGKTSASDQILLTPDNTIRNEALSALVMLGFAKKPAEQAVDSILAADSNTSVESVVKQALKSL